MPRPVLTVVIAILLSLAVGAQEAGTLLGSVLGDAPDQVGVYRARLDTGPTLKKGDVVGLDRGGEVLAEAVLLKVGEGWAMLSVRGDFEARTGDRLTFLRRPVAVVAPPPAPVEATVTSPAHRPTSSRIVTSEAEVRSLSREVLDFLRKRFGISWARRLVLHCRAGGMQAAEALGNRLGNTFYTTNAFDVTIVYGLPEDLVRAALAHEFAHCWMDDRRLYSKRPDWFPEQQWLEGFASWVQYKYLVHSGRQGAAAECLADLNRMAGEAAPADDYGLGFQKFRGIEARSGEAGVLNLVYCGVEKPQR